MTAKLVNLGTERVPVGALKPHPKNPRRGDVETIRASIRKTGFYGTIVARPDGTILAGKHRWDAAIAEGLTEVDVTRVKVDAKTALRILIADNRASDLATYDNDALISLLAELPDLEGTGYDQAALDALIAGNPNIAGPARSLEPDELPPMPARTPTTRPGDVWEIGPHRLACGDTSKPAAWAALFAGAPAEAADMIFTSPPYNVGVDYDGHDDDTVPWPDLRAFLEPCLRESVAHLDRGRALCWNIGVSPKTQPYRQGLLLEEVGLSFHRQLVWRKVGVPVPLFHFTKGDPRARQFTPNYSHEVVLIFAAGALEPPADPDPAKALRIVPPGHPGWAPTDAHELVVVMVNGDALAKGKAVAFHDTLADDVFSVNQSQSTRDLPGGTSGRTGSKSNLERRSRKAHPAPFPVALPEAFIAHLADVGAIVVDPFAGAGSTLVAAHRLGRVGYGIELAPAYCDVALSRLQSHTGMVPTLDGKAHDFVKAAQ